ncbi:hypothetical protein BH10BAC2_BH10BAC2_47270 [soil metagenome]
MKTTRSGLILAVLIAMISASSCSVEYRTKHPRHPRPQRGKKVIVVGKADTNEKINDNGVVQKPDETNVAAY